MVRHEGFPPQRTSNSFGYAPEEEDVGENKEEEEEGEEEEEDFVKYDSCPRCNKNLEDGYCRNCLCCPKCCKCRTNRKIVYPKGTQEEVPVSEDKSIMRKEVAKEKVTTAIARKNKSAATSAARVEAGKILVHKGITVIRSQAPAAAGAYMDHPLAGLFVANLAFALAYHYLPDNERLQAVADIMVEGAMQEFVSGFDIEKMLDKFLADVDLDGILPPKKTAVIESKGE